MQKSLLGIAHSARFYRLFRWIAYFTALALMVTQALAGFACTIGYAARQTAWQIWVEWGVFTAQVQQIEAEYRKAKNQQCKAPPKGWYCTRPVGHGGPCATHKTIKFWNL